MLQFHAEERWSMLYLLLLEDYPQGAPTKGAPRGPQGSPQQTPQMHAEADLLMLQIACKTEEEEAEADKEERGAPEQH